MIQRMIDIRTDHDESRRQPAAAIGYHQVQIARYEMGAQHASHCVSGEVLQALPRQRGLCTGLPRGLEWPRG